MRPRMRIGGEDAAVSQIEKLLIQSSPTGSTRPDVRERLPPWIRRLRVNLPKSSYAKEIENRASMEQEIDYEEWEIAGGMLNDWREAKRNLNSPNLDTTPT